jgi:hypothetical protein
MLTQALIRFSAVLVFVLTLPVMAFGEFTRIELAVRGMD